MSHAVRSKASSQKTVIPMKIGIHKNLIITNRIQEIILPWIPFFNGMTTLREKQSHNHTTPSPYARGDPRISASYQALPLADLAS